MTTYRGLSWQIARLREAIEGLIVGEVSAGSLTLPDDTLKALDPDLVVDELTAVLTMFGMSPEAIAGFMAGTAPILEATVAQEPGNVEAAIENADSLLLLMLALGASNSIGQGTIGGLVTALGESVDTLGATVDGHTTTIGEHSAALAGIAAETPSLVSMRPIQLGAAGSTIATKGSDDWDSDFLNEPDSLKFDTETGDWITAYSGRNVLASPGTVVLSSVGAVISTDGDVNGPGTWGAPIFIAEEAEDPHITTDLAGVVHRDGAGLALLFTEAKDYATHIGIDLYHSTADAWGPWTRFGSTPVMEASVAGWDSTDVSSPHAIALTDLDLFMLYEGRGPGNEGMIGRAVSDDGGETWTKDVDPLIATKAGTDYALSVVPDDLLRVVRNEGTPNETTLWVLVAHGQDVDTNYRSLRFATTDAPDDWTPSSFVPFGAIGVSDNNPEVMLNGASLDSVIAITNGGDNIKNVPLAFVAGADDQNLLDHINIGKRLAELEAAP